MMLKTPPNSSVCTGSNQTGESVSAVRQENTTAVRARKLTSTGAGSDGIDEQQDHNQGGDISLNSYDATVAAADHGRQRPMALDQENSNKSPTTVRASGSIHEHGSHIGNDSISNCQDERQKQVAAFSTSSTQVNDNNNDEGSGREVRRIGRLSTPDRGRIMVARSMIPRGTFLYRLAAQATVCDTDNRTRRCASCLKQIGSHDHDMVVVKEEKVEAVRKVGGGGHGCEGCGEIWYCDHACADRDWEVLHAAECRFLKALYQGLPSTTTTSSNDNINTDEDEAAWMTSVGNPHREAITRFSQQGFEPYTQDYCRVLIRTLTHRFHEFTDPPLSIQLGVTPADPPYLESADPNQPQGPLPYSDVEDLVMNRESFSREMVEGEFRDVVRILDAFQSHLEVSYLPRMDRCRRQHKGAMAMTGNALKPPRRLLETELMNLIMREECNSFGMYEYPPFPLPPPTTTATAAASTDAGEESEGKDNSKICYALGFFVRQHLYGFNHSCSPNLFHVAHNNRLLLYAARDIQPGEEINITYLEFGPHYRIPPPPGAEAGARKGVEEEEEEGRRKKKEAFEKRKRFLKSHFHFDCGCARCTYEATLYSTSNDDAKERVKGLTGGKEERFLREGLSCEREGCFGFYAPPAVLRARQDNEGSKNGWDDGSNVGGRWGCVACGRLQF